MNPASLFITSSCPSERRSNSRASYTRHSSKSRINVATFVPKFVVFLIILIVGWLIAKVITKVLSAVLTRVGFDKAVERGGIKKALESSKYDASDILAKIVYYALMLFVLSTAFGVFGNNPASSYLHAVVAYLPLVFVAIVIVVIAPAIAAAAKALIENMPRRGRPTGPSAQGV